MKFASFVAGLGVVSWLLKDRLVPVPDPSRLEAPPAFKQPPPAAPEPVAPEPVAAQPPADLTDDLTDISGIGPSFAAQLGELGITSFAALADADADTVAEAVVGASAAQVRDWQDQARARS